MLRLLAMLSAMLALAACRYEPVVSLPVDPPAVPGASLEREATRIAGAGARNCGASHGALRTDIRQCAARSVAAGAPFYCVFSVSATLDWREGVACAIPQPPAARAYAGNREGEVFEIRHGWGGGPPWEVERVLVRGRHVGEALRPSNATTSPAPPPGFVETLEAERFPDGDYVAELEVSPSGDLTRATVERSATPEAGERLNAFLRRSRFGPGRFFEVPVPMIRWIYFDVTGGAVTRVGPEPIATGTRAPG